MIKAMASRQDIIDRLIDEQYELYERSTPASYERVMADQAVSPLGSASSLQHFAPWPPVIDYGQASMLVDLDGNRYHDFHGAFGVGVMGHCHPAIVKAISAQAARLIVAGFPDPVSGDWMAAISERFGGLVQLTNSGTEATMLALRVARAATKRQAIIKIEGGYHGAHEGVMYATLGSGFGEKTNPALAWGDAHEVTADMLAAPFNDIEFLHELLATHDVAAVLLEPVMFNVGLLEPRDGYLQAVRRLCDEYGALCIWDEVKTGVALAWAGAAQYYDIPVEDGPHLRCLGKGLGGGLPCGAVCGPAHLLETIVEGQAPHVSTFAGSPVVAAAGLACLDDVLTPEAYDHLTELSDLLCTGLNELIARYKIHAHVVCLGAKGHIFFGGELPAEADYRLLEKRQEADMALLMRLCLLNEGVMLPPGRSEQWTLSVQHQPSDIEAFLRAFQQFAELCQREGLLDG